MIRVRITKSIWMKLDETMNSQINSLADLVSTYKQRSGLSFNQLARQTGVPAKTITSWSNGFVKRPRRWQDLVHFAHALQLTKVETNQLLQAANHSDIDSLITIANDKELEVLQNWQEKTPPFQLPRLHIHQFVGRVHEQQRAIQALLENNQLCVIQGMGGIGKTTLVVQIAESLITHFRDGILWADMRNMENEQILESWAAAYHVDISRFPTVDSRASFMWSVLASKNVLLILDDASSLKRVKQLIPPRLGTLSVFVTTRQKTVAHSLATDDNMLISLQPMRNDSSLQLLKDILGETSLPSEKLVEEEICQLVGHLPLAINIFARRAKALKTPLPLMLEQLRNIRTRLDKLNIGDEGVRAAFEQSWELLDEQLKHIFQLLALFSGRSFSLEAFAHIAQLDQLTATTMLGELYALFLLDVMVEEPRRYKQHPLLASFAHERAQIAPEDYLRLATYYQAFAAEYALDSRSIREDGKNIMAGMKYAFEQCAWELVNDYQEIMHPIWFSQAQYDNARQGLAWANEANIALNHLEKIADIQLNWGVACLEQSDYPESKQKLHRSLQLYQEIEHLAGIASVHYHLARLQIEQDNYDDAEQNLREAWRHYQLNEDLSGMANALYRMGNIAYHRGAYTEATQLCNDALSLQKELNNQLGILRVLLRLTMIALAEGNVNEARTYCADMLKRSEAIENQAELARTFYTVANLCRQQGEFEMARDYIIKGLTLFQQMGDRSSEANALNVAALIDLDWNQADQTKVNLAATYEYAQQSREICDQLGFQFGVAVACLTLGRVHIQMSNVNAACSEWEAALAIAQTIESKALITRLNELQQEAC